MGFGVVYKLDASGHQTVLHAFTGEEDGAEPYAGVLRDSAGIYMEPLHPAGNTTEAWYFRLKALRRRSERYRCENSVRTVINA
jgi:hypothetical protein